MVSFITFLRAIASCLITNAHYTGIYPTDLIANGGLLGDVIFFAVSGYCLYSVKDNFVSWYGKRLWRCYLPVVIATVVYMLLGYYTFNAHSFVWWYVYPTYYHFVASIVVLYIPYFIILKLEFLKKRIPLIMVALGAVYLVVYIFVYDKSYYHIDNVREPFIRFLFMECMLLGAYFRQNDEKYRNKFNRWHIVAAVVGFFLYFASKLVFSKTSSIAGLQILNQVIIFALLYFALRIFSGIDNLLETSPAIIKRIASFLASITLEIYVVQYVLIDLIRSLNLVFPINWICLTALIVLSAFILHFVCGQIIRVVDCSIKKIKNKCSK